MFHTLAGAVLLELAVEERVEIADRMTWKGRPVHALDASPPTDPILRDTWERVAASAHAPLTEQAPACPPESPPTPSITDLVSGRP